MKIIKKSILWDCVNEILDDICNLLFHEDLKESLRKFLPNYINYLAYKIEAKVELKESLDKLEGIIWQDMMELFQSLSSGGLKDQFEEQIREIDNKIKIDPDNIDLYNSKVSILLYYEQLEDVLKLLDEMLEIFAENEIGIKMKKASVLRRMRDVERGIDIVNDLIEKYPENNDLLNFKVYWLQYLNRKEEALQIIQDLTNSAPNNGTYHDTYGEILMFYEEYEKAVKKFQKTIAIATDEWYINQTYIKLGICYKELKNFDLAIQNLKKGKDLTNVKVTDTETKQKWLAIADLFLAEIQQYL